VREPDTLACVWVHRTKGQSLKKFWKYLAVTVLSLVVVGICGGLLLFKLAQRQVAGRLQPPELVAESIPETDFTFRTLDGKVRQLSEFKGKVVFLDLWGTWCFQCVAEMPTVQKLYSHYKGSSQVEFLIVSRWDSPQSVQRYAHRNDFDLPFYVTRDDDVPASMHLNQFPATFIFSKDGRLVMQHAGGADWADRSVFKFIDELKNR
jgi:thiol-disulfide isomerase/thioredoxin